MQFDSIGTPVGIVFRGLLCGWVGLTIASARAQHGAYHSHEPFLMTAEQTEHCRKTNPWVATKLPFEPTGRSPCWRSELGISCFPIVYILGFPKCGTTTLYHRLALHPELSPSARKEPHWWTRCHKSWKNGGRCAAPDDSDNLTMPLREPIETQSRFTNSAARYAKKHFPDFDRATLAFEASASTAWDSGPRHCGDTVPQSMQRVYGPQWALRLRFILVVRNAVDRSWSDYLYSYRRGRARPSQGDFHEKVLHDTNNFLTCNSTFSIEHCATLPNQQLRLHLGLYAHHLRKWFISFSRAQFLIIRSEDYFSNPKDVLTRVFQFLEVSQPSAEQWKKILVKETSALARSSHVASPYTPKVARNDTIALLNRFFAPFIAEINAIIDANP